MNFLSRLLSSVPGTPEAPAFLGLIGMLGLIVFTACKFPLFDSTEYAWSVSIILGGMAGGSMAQGVQRKLEADKTRCTEKEPDGEGH